MRNHRNLKECDKPAPFPLRLTDWASSVHVPRASDVQFMLHGAEVFLGQARESPTLRWCTSPLYIYLPHASIPWHHFHDTTTVYRENLARFKVRDLTNFVEFSFSKYLPHILIIIVTWSPISAEVIYPFKCYATIPCPNSSFNLVVDLPRRSSEDWKSWN